MRRVRAEGNDKEQKKRKLNKPKHATGYEEDLNSRPKVESSSVYHIALLYKGRDTHLAQELSRALLPAVARSLGIYRRR